MPPHSQIGDRVMAFVNYNAWAEVVCTPVEFVYKIPDDMSYSEAAAFPMNFVTAYMMLFEVANLREGMSVLVHSAGGGVVSWLVVHPLPCNRNGESGLIPSCISSDDLWGSGWSSRAWQSSYRWLCWGQDEPLESERSSRWHVRTQRVSEMVSVFVSQWTAASIMVRCLISHVLLILSETPKWWWLTLSINCHGF